MTTKTDLANYALAHVGLQTITDIDDEENPTAVTCKQFIDQVIDEGLRSHRWNCSIMESGLSALSPDPSDEWSYRYQMPGDSLRLLDVNDRPYTGSNEYFEIRNGGELFSNESPVRITYVARIGVNDMDPLLAEACALKLASKIVVPLSAALPLQQQMIVLYEACLSRAKQVDAVETGSRENRPLARMMSQSILLNSYYRRGGNLLEYGRYHVPWV